MSMICILSGGQVRALRRELETDWEVRVLSPMWGTTLPSGVGLVVVTDSAVGGSFGAADACRRLLLSATCRGLPIVCVLTPGAGRDECQDVPGIISFAQGLVCRKSEAVRLLDAPWDGTDMTLRRRYGLEYVRILPPSAPTANVWRQVTVVCRRLMGEEDRHAKTCGGV